MKHTDIIEAKSRLKACAKLFASRVRWQASPDAPSTYKEMVESFKIHHMYIVWNGASDQTIFGDSTGNIWFRVWHDYTHIKLDVDFKPHNEYRVLLQQQNDYTAVRGDSFDNVDVIALELLRLEIYGQRVFYEAHNAYLEKQEEFADSMLHTQNAVYKMWIMNEKEGV